MGNSDVTFWLVVGLMCVFATMFVAWPLYQQQRRFTGLIAGSIGAVVLLSLTLYAWQGSPGISSGAGAQPDVEAMVSSLAAKLENNPDDLNGWKMLARSYMTLQDFPAAVEAFEHAVALEDAQDAQTLVNLGGALLARDNTRIEGRTSALFESALALQSNNPEALFYGGIAALNRGDTNLAADRWEILLGLNPPDEIRGVIAQRVAEWRGTPLEQPGVVVTADIELSTSARAALPAEASVFVIARDPAQPSPPIAVARRLLSDLPAIITLSDSDSMIPGRTLSTFPEVEVVARVSVSGQPIAQSGDWFASAIVTPAEQREITLQIDQQVP